MTNIPMIADKDASYVVKFEGRKSVLLLAETHWELNGEEIGRVVEELGLIKCQALYYVRSLQVTMPDTVYFNVGPDTFLLCLPFASS